MEEDDNMMNRTVRKVISLVAALCLALTAGAGALAEGAQDMADFEALTPLMDLVCAASQYSPNAPESVPGADGVLTVSFTDAFFKVGQTYGAEVGVTADMINDTNAQAELLSKIFAAQLPQLEPVVMTDDINGFIGFHPVTVNRGADSATVQIIGEIYLADKPMREMSEADYSNVQWLERAVFTFQSDSTALNGFRLMGYSVGTSPLMSFQYGAQNHTEMRSLLWKSLGIIGVASIVMFLLGQWLAAPLSAIFVSYDAALLELTVSAYKLYALCFLFMGFAMYASAFFTALNNGLVSALISFLRTLVFQVAAVIVLPMLFGIDGIWLSVTVGDGLTCLVAATFMIALSGRYGYRKGGLSPKAKAKAENGD